MYTSIPTSGLRECRDRNGVIEFPTWRDKRTEAIVGLSEVRVSRFQRLMFLKTAALEPLDASDGMKSRARCTARRSGLQRWIGTALTIRCFTRPLPVLR